MNSKTQQIIHFLTQPKADLYHLPEDLKQYLAFSMASAESRAKMLHARYGLGQVAIIEDSCRTCDKYGHDEDCEQCGGLLFDYPRVIEILRYEALSNGKVNIVTDMFTLVTDQLDCLTLEENS